MWADELASGHINRSSFIGLDGLFDLFRICVKKSVDENPDLIKNFVSDFSKERVNTAVDYNEQGRRTMWGKVRI